MRCFGTKKEQRRRRKKKKSKSEGDEPNGRMTEVRDEEEEERRDGRKKEPPKKTKKSKSKEKNGEDTERMELKTEQKRQNGGGPPRRMSAERKMIINGGERESPVVMAGGGIEFVKITDRIFALLFPSGSPDTIYRQNIKLMSDRIKRTFADRYKIFNLSQKRSDLGRAHPQGAVVEFGWPDMLAPPLDRLCSICKQIENHQNAGALEAENVAIIHCKGGVYRAGIVVAAFMHYSSICDSEANVADRFSMKLFTERFLGLDAQPSHKRYVKYFANLLSGAVKVYPSPVLLTNLSLMRIFPGRMVTLKLYERMKPVWSSGKITLTDHSAVDLPGGRLSLRGDVLLKCYLPSSSNGGGGNHQQEKQLLFQCQFNTCALNLEAMASPRVLFYKEELDYLQDDQLVEPGASVQLCFDLGDHQHPSQPPAKQRKSASPGQHRKSASPAAGRMGSVGPAGVGGGDFSRADSYENFDRAEDERSLSLPAVVVASSPLDGDATLLGNGRCGGVAQDGSAPSGEQHQQQVQEVKRHHSPVRSVPIDRSTQPHHQHPQQQQISTPSACPATDGCDSGIGSDSPKAKPGIGGLEVPKAADANGRREGEEEEDHPEAVEEGEEMMIGSRKAGMPPPVPPKTRRHSVDESLDDELDPDDPMRSAFEDSTIGRDHSVLPPGARPPTLSRRHSTASSTTAGEGGERGSMTGSRKVCPMVQPELVATGRYDPNSRCFSYVPVKSLKAHYSAPKKPPPVLKRRTSVVDDLDAPATPTEAQLALRNLGRKSPAQKRPETPKWETEIDKVAGRVEPMPERRPRRASTSFTPVGHLQHDYVRSPSAQTRSAQEEWRWRQQKGRMEPPVEALLNGYYERQFMGKPEGTEGWELGEDRGGARRREAHTVPRMKQLMTEGERPMVVDQAKRATPVPARHSPLLQPSQQFRAAEQQYAPNNLGLRFSASAPAPSGKPSPRSAGRQEMDALCDPDFYLSYATPDASPAPGRRTQQQPPEPKQRSQLHQPGELLSKSVPNDRQFRKAAQNELMRDDVRDLLAEHQMGAAPRRSQTPQNMGIGGKGRYTAPLREEFRARNCRSVNSTPLIGNRKLFIHTEDASGGTTDSEAGKGSEDWLNAKLRALKGKRYVPEAGARRDAERMLLEELKQKSTKSPAEQRRGDPVAEYRREEQRLRNAQSPLLVMDNPLRLANKNLQVERAREFLKNQPIQTIEPFSTFPPRSPPPPASFTLQNSAIPNINNVTPRDSPIVTAPLQQPIRRGATPTGQIVRGKPPTPPPTTMSRGDFDRARSKSPYSAKLWRGASSSAPPPQATVAAPANPATKRQPEATERRESNPMVNPQLYALRQSLYAQERGRMDGGGEQFVELPESGEEEPIFGTSHPLLPSHPSASSSSHPFSASANAQQQQHRSTPPVKPILKRTNGGNGTNGGGGMGGIPEWGAGRAGGGGGANPAAVDVVDFPGRHQPPGNYNNGHSSSLLADRSDTPQFPVPERAEQETPAPYHPLLYRRDTLEGPLLYRRDTLEGPGEQRVMAPPTMIRPAQGGTRSGAITPYGMFGGGTSSSLNNRRASLNSVDGAEVIHHHPIFVRDTSRYWYKPTISREDAIAMLKNKSPGTFIVRDSNSFPGAFGLALKVAQPPPGVPSSADGSELVRHFLIEPSPKGVRLKGCSNEPVFGTLSALVYQHSITPLALPCRLILPEHDPASTPEHLNSNQALLERGAACNVTYLCSVDTESLTGPEALRRSISYSFDLLQKRELRAVPVHFKVSAQGITLTDNTRSLFFRRHYPVNTVTFAGIDPESRVFDNNNVAQLPPTYVRQAPVFGFVARKCAGFGDLTNGGGINVENACHLFAELDPDQPASAVVRFITNVMMPASRAQQQQQLQIHHQSANNVR